LQILPTNRRSEGTTDYAAIANSNQNVDQSSIQVEVNHNPEKSEAGTNAREISNSQLDALSKIIVKNKISPKNILAHWAVQGTHPDPNWLGINGIHPSQNDGKTNPQILRLVKSTKYILNNIQTTPENNSLKQAWEQYSKIIANQIIKTNIMNALNLFRGIESGSIAIGRNSLEITRQQLDAAVYSNKQELAEIKFEAKLAKSNQEINPRHTFTEVDNSQPTFRRRDWKE
jgi:hypothetical protein